MKILILIALLYLQPPKWKYIVYWETLKGSTAMPSISNPDAVRTRNVPKRVYFMNSIQAHAFFNDKIKHRKTIDKSYIAGEPVLIMKVWIDSVKTK